MDYASSSNSTISLSPSDAKGSAILKAIFLLNFCINLFGAFLHFGLILVTFRNHRFHFTCNLLIAANSISTILAYALVLCPLWLLWFTADSVHLRLLPCFLIQLIPLFATFHVFSLMLAIGFDRLLSAFWAIWYISRNDRFCLLLLLSASLTFPLFITAIAFSNVLAKPNAEKLCTLGDLLGRNSSFVSICCLCCIFLSICCYLLVWIRLKNDIKKGQFETVRSRQPIFLSLCFILGLQVGGWVFGQLIYATIYMNEQRISPLARWEFNSLVLCFLSFTAAMDVPILYSTSSDYKLAFHKQFPCLSKFIAIPRDGKRKKKTSAGMQKLHLSHDQSSRSPVVTINPRF